MNKEKAKGGKRPGSSFVSKKKSSGKPKMGKIFGSRVRFKEVSGGNSSRNSEDRNRRGGNRGGNSSRGRSRKKAIERIDVSKFIKKADVFEEQKPYVPQHTFTDFGFSKVLEDTILRRGFVNPSPIQDGAIPASLKGQDVLGIANTGTGKTAAFLLPIIESFLLNRKQKALILAPTRELALQIEKEFRAFTTREMKLFSVSLVGGAPLGPQRRELERGVQIIIGTPGRVQDMIRRNLVNLQSINHIVLDEVDQMLDMGFVDDITTILKTVPQDTQKYFFSATLEPRINNLIDAYLENPARVLLKQGDTARYVEQNVVRVEKSQNKIDVLCNVLSQEHVSKTIIFAETKRDVQKLHENLESKGFKSGSLHGDKRHGERVRILENFKKNGITILVATDVAARGIDVPDVSHVINYEVPRSYDTYVHRIGRTGRANKQGNALTFI